MNVWYICLVFLRLIGLAPISWNRDITAGNVIQISGIGRFYCMILLTIFTLIHLYFVNDKTLLEIQNNILLYARDICFLVINFTIIFTTFLTFILKQSTAVLIYQELHDINQLLEFFNKDYRRKKVNMKLQLLILMNMVFCVILLADQVSTNNSTVFHWTMIINNILVGMIISQYVGIIVLMSAMAETINDQFQWFYDHANAVVEVKTKNKDVKNCNVPSIRAAKIDVLQEVYLKLVKTANSHAEFYSLIMLICIMKRFFALLVNAFSITSKTLMREESIVKDWPNTFVLIYVIRGIFFLLSITFSVTKLTSEVSSSID